MWGEGDYVLVLYSSATKEREAGRCKEKERMEVNHRCDDHES